MFFLRKQSSKRAFSHAKKVHNDNYLNSDFLSHWLSSTNIILKVLKAYEIFVSEILILVSRQAFFLDNFECTKVLKKES